MRSHIVGVAAALPLLAGCSGLLTAQPEPTPATTATPNPESWVMSADSFGPITMQTTESEALATGVYRRAPSPCSDERLDWRSQKYGVSQSEPDRKKVKPYMGSITYGDNGKPTFIDPGKDTVTDRGIRKADSLSRLQLTYGDELISAPDQLPAAGTFAVKGKRSYLLFEVMFNKVVGFYIVAGVPERREDILPGRFLVNGVLTMPDKMPQHHGSIC